MKRYSHQQIEALLDKFMDGQTTVEEEALLADYFRNDDVPAKWEDYRFMFDYFDRGMEGELVPVQEPQPSFTRLMGKRWWGIAAAACITAAIVGTLLLHHRSSTPSLPEMAEVTTVEKQETSISIKETQDNESIQTPASLPAETPHLASQASSLQPTSKRSRSSRRLQAENKKLAEENERLQRELADLKRRSFIIDLEANGYKAVLDEDGSIVLIDLEQEIENELNNQPTSNIPSI